MNTFTSDILSLVFGGLMIIMTFAIEFPQMVSIIKTRNTSGTSLSSYIIFFIATSLWFIWALVNYVANIQHLGHDYDHKQHYEIVLHVIGLAPAVLANSMGVLLLSCVLFCKVKNLVMCKKLNISEIAYSKIVFDKHKKDSWIKKYYPLVIIAASVLILLLIIILVIWIVGVPTQISDSEYDKYEWTILGLNIAAAVFLEVTSWPQFIKCMKTKDTSGISLGWAIFMPASCLVSLSYDIFLTFSTDWRSMAASIICNGVIINVLVLILKIRNFLKAKKLGISEWKYTNKYIAPKKKTKL